MRRLSLDSASRLLPLPQPLLKHASLDDAALLRLKPEAGVQLPPAVAAWQPRAPELMSQRCNAFEDILAALSTGSVACSTSSEASADDSPAQAAAEQAAPAVAVPQPAVQAASGRVSRASSCSSPAGRLQLLLHACEPHSPQRRPLPAPAAAQGARAAVAAGRAADGSCSPVHGESGAAVAAVAAAPQQAVAATAVVGVPFSFLGQLWGSCMAGACTRLLLLAVLLLPTSLWVPMGRQLAATAATVVELHGLLATLQLQGSWRFGGRFRALARAGAMPATCLLLASALELLLLWLLVQGRPWVLGLPLLITACRAVALRATAAGGSECLPAVRRKGQSASCARQLGTGCA
jgi:hypothetical protein